jgi:hypothetical protein
MRYVARTSLAVLLSVGTAQSAFAQEAVRSGSRTAVDGIEFVSGMMLFDLSGTGSTVPFAVRGSKALTDRLALEFGATFASPDQRFGSSRIALPEAQVSYSWRFGRVRPFVGGGGGLSVISSEAIETRWRPTFSAGGGARIQLHDRLYAIGEMRLRGISRRFTGSTAEWLGGLGWSMR